MQRVVFHSTFPSLIARNSLVGFIWGLLKSHLRNSSTPTNHYEHFQWRPGIFRRFPKIFRRFKKITKYLENTFELFLTFIISFINRLSLSVSLKNRFEAFQKFSETRGDIRALPKISISFRRFRHGIKQLCNAFSWNIVKHATCHWLVCVRKIQVTRGIFHGIPLESIA